MSRRLRSTDVFLNCPFDSSYRQVFNSIVFAIYDLGFTPRCALEIDDGTQFRLEKISSIVAECRYGIHDLSFVRLDRHTHLPRFNMPFELGLYLGCKRFGGKAQVQKACLILDRSPYRYRAFISDLSGQDIHAYNGQPRGAIQQVRDWLRTASQHRALPGGIEIYERYKRFRRDIPLLCEQLRRKPEELTFADYSETVEIWLRTNR